MKDIFLIIKNKKTYHMWVKQMKKEHILNENDNKIPYVSKIKEIKRTLGNK